MVLCGAGGFREGKGWIEDSSWSVCMYVCVKASNVYACCMLVCVCFFLLGVVRYFLFCVCVCLFASAWCCWVFSVFVCVCAPSLICQPHLPLSLSCEDLQDAAQYKAGGFREGAGWSKDSAGFGSLVI